MTIVLVLILLAPASHPDAPARTLTAPLGVGRATSGLGLVAPAEEPRRSSERQKRQRERVPGNHLLESAPRGITHRPAWPARLAGTTLVDRIVREAAYRHRVDPRLVLAVIHQESGGHRYARSPKGACGYMQLMPATARRFGVVDAFDPRQNVDAGVRYLRWLLDLFGGRVDLALAGYNAGEGRVIRAGCRVPSIRETQHYVRAITARYGRLFHPW